MDLHGLHVDEALEVLAELLCRREQGTFNAMVVSNDAVETWLQYICIFDAYYMDSMIVSECDFAFHIVLIQKQ